MKNKYSHRANRKYQLITVFVTILVLNAALVWFIPVSPDRRETLVGVAYALLVTGFLLAQFWGFIVSQTDYDESIEESKFKMLENEEAEWVRR